MTTAPPQTPLARAVYHVLCAANYLGIAVDLAAYFARIVWREGEAVTPTADDAAETCAWNLESAEWHLSQIPAAYRSNT